MRNRRDIAIRQPGYRESGQLMTRRTRASLSAARTGSVEMWAAGNDRAHRSAVCGDQGQVLWCASRGHKDGMHPAWRLASADTVAAGKAIWLAGQGGATRLRLHVADPNLDPQLLDTLARTVGVELDVSVTAERNPAMEWCRERYSKVGASVPPGAADSRLRWSASGRAVAS
jgi:hypothetical protein